MGSESDNKEMCSEGHLTRSRGMPACSRHVSWSCQACVAMNMDTGMVEDQSDSSSATGFMYNCPNGVKHKSEIQDWVYAYQCRNI